ncbi:MAG: ArsB/NhaD family transporter [bacterium]|nr:ArsB/NhaD family transporter [bacterium]
MKPFLPFRTNMSEGISLANQLIAGVIFVLTFTLIFSERVHRTIIAMFGACVMVAFGTRYGFYSQEDALKAIDANTIFLLMGMMIVVANLKRTGLFNYLAVKGAKISKGNPWILLVLLGTITTVLSMILDNVTTIILIGPVTILIMQTLGISATPILIAEALLSNVGGVGTMVGDPPNIIIGSAAPFTFNDFLLHTLPPVVVAWLATLLTFRFVFCKELSQKPEGIKQIMAMDEYAAIRDVRSLKRCLFTLTLMILFFFIHHRLHLEPSFVAMFGASLVFLLIRPEPDEILHDVEWAALLFFIALFVLVGGVEHSGVLEVLGEGLVGLAKDNMILAPIILLWVAAITSAIVDNIPFTMTMVPIIKHVAAAGMNPNPLWWSLALGVGFGGNGTPIGATANVVVVSMSEKTKDRITFRKWFKSGSIIMLITCLVATLFLICLPGVFR